MTLFEIIRLMWAHWCPIFLAALAVVSLAVYAREAQD